MLVFKGFKDLNKHLNHVRNQDPNLIIGLVPTMGALHQGHLSLVRQCNKDCDLTICSIFVNPTQFNKQNDLTNYPKPIAQDISLLIQAQCDVLLLPDVQEVYPESYVHQTFDIKNIDNIIEGKSRVGHFQGVCNVIYRFFSEITPHKAYFGQKDFQQTVVIKKLVALVGLRVDIVVCPIVRENNGLAMSSRNIRLSRGGKQEAKCIYEALCILKKHYKKLGISNSIGLAKKHILATKGTEIDYLVVVNTSNLAIAKEQNRNEMIALVVVNFEGIRLLDNLILS